MDKKIYLNWLKENVKLQLNIGEALVSVSGKGNMWVPDRPNQPGIPAINPGIAARDPNLATKVQSVIDLKRDKKGEIPLEKEEPKPGKAKFNPRAVRPKDDVKIGNNKKGKTKPLGTVASKPKTNLVDPTTKGTTSTQVSKTGERHAFGQSRDTIKPTPVNIRESFNSTVYEILKKEE